MLGPIRAAVEAAGATNVDHFAVGDRAEADAEHVDVAALGAQEIDVAVARHRHEAARQRHVAQRQFVDALERAASPQTAPQRPRHCRHELGMFSANTNMRPLVIDLEEFDRTEPIAHPQAKFRERRRLHVLMTTNFDLRAGLALFRNHVDDNGAGAA